MNHSFYNYQEQEDKHSYCHNRLGIANFENCLRDDEFRFGMIECALILD